MSDVLVENSGRAGDGVVVRCVLMALLCVAGVQFYVGAVNCLSLVLSARAVGHTDGAAAAAVVGAGEGLVSAAVFWVLVFYLRRAARTWGLRPWVVRSCVYGLVAALLADACLFGSLAFMRAWEYAGALALPAAVVVGAEWFNSAVIENGASDGQPSDERGGD